MNNSIKDSTGDQVFTVINYTFLSVLTLIILYPLIFIVSSSFSSTEAVSSGRVWLFPVEFSLDGYKAIFKNEMIWIGYANSLFYMIAGTMINVVLTIMASYPLSRSDFRGRHIFMFLFVFTMMFDGGLIPTYLLVRDLGMLNTRWALMIPKALSVFNVIIALTFFRSTIPKSLHESAQIDGCSDFRFLFRIVLPLSAPIIAVLSLFYAVSHWNQYFEAMIYLRDKSLFPLQLVLRSILTENDIDPDMVSDISLLEAKVGLTQLLKYALIVVASIPVLVIYPFVQKHFVKGVMIGSIKG